MSEPGGTETTTRRPVWRVRDEDGRELWAYVEVRGTEPFITGYAKYEVRTHHHVTSMSVVVGSVIGAGVGYWMGGWFGAFMGGVYGVMVGAAFRARR